MEKGTETFGVTSTGTLYGEKDVKYLQLKQNSVVIELGDRQSNDDRPDDDSNTRTPGVLTNPTGSSLSQSVAFAHVLAASQASVQLDPFQTLLDREVPL